MRNKQLYIKVTFMHNDKRKSDDFVILELLKFKKIFDNLSINKS